MNEKHSLHSMIRTNNHQDLYVQHIVPGDIRPDDD